MNDPSLECWKGYAVMMLVLLVTFTSSMFTQHAQFVAARLSVRVRSALVNLIYRKRLRVATQLVGSKNRNNSWESDRPISAGDFENFEASDMQRIQVLVITYTATL